MNSVELHLEDLVNKGECEHSLIQPVLCKQVQVQRQIFKQAMRKVVSVLVLEKGLHTLNHNYTLEGTHI